MAKRRCGPLGCRNKQMFLKEIKDQTPSVIPPSLFIEAIGGIITYDGDYKIHTFNASDNFEITNMPVGATIEYLVIGGGGGGGAATANSYSGGGGGGGGYLAGNLPVAIQSYVVTVGLGGGGGNSGNMGWSNANSQSHSKKQKQV